MRPISAITSGPDRHGHDTTDHGGGGLSPASARRIAERAHAGQLAANGEPYMAHVRRVAAGVPSFARPVAWLHDVMERSSIEESELIAAGASTDECVALRLLCRDPGGASDDRYMQHVRSIALSPGASGQIARAVKRADLLDHAFNPPSIRPDGWTPPYEAAFVVLTTLTSNGSAAADS